MQDVIHAVDRSLGDAWVRQIAFLELNIADLLEIVALSGDQAVDDADAVPAADKLMGEMRANEARTAGDEVVCHGQLLQPARGSPGVTFNAFW
jgi:hypothetical protein